MTVDWKGHTRDGNRLGAAPPSETRGASPRFLLEGVGIDGNGDGTNTYGRCPACGDQLKLPFYKHDRIVWIPHIHVRTRGKNCRVLLAIHPTGRVGGKELPDGLSFEDALHHFKIRLREA